MKYRSVAVLLVSTALSSISSNAWSDEEYDRYVYNDDGTYHKAGEGNKKSAETPASGNSAGFLETSGGFIATNTTPEDISVWGLRGSYASGFSDRLNIQVDGQVEYRVSDYGESTGFGGAIHLAYRDPDKYALGLFAQTYLPDGSWKDDSLTQASIGVESAINFESATIYGRIGYNHVSLSDYDSSGILTQAGVRYFATDNLRFDLDASYSDPTAAISIAGNYRLDQSPVSIFAGYSYTSTDYGYWGDLETGTLFAGLRMHFDSESLRDEERNGLLWATIE